MVIQSYILGLICCLLNLRVLDYSDDADTWTKANTIITLVMFPIYVLFPIFGIQFICRNFERLDDPVIRNKFGELTEGLNIKSRGMVVYWAVDLFRRICLAYVVVLAR